MNPIVFEALILGAFVIFAFTQVLLPAITGTPYFPSFRFRRKIQALDEAESAVVDTQLDAETETVKKEIECLNEPPPPPQPTPQPSNESYEARLSARRSSRSSSSSRLAEKSSKT